MFASTPVQSQSASHSRHSRHSQSNTLAVRQANHTASQASTDNTTAGTMLKKKIEKEKEKEKNEKKKNPPARLRQPRGSWLASVVSGVGYQWATCSRAQTAVGCPSHSEVRVLVHGVYQVYQVRGRGEHCCQSSEATESRPAVLVCTFCTSCASCASWYRFWSCMQLASASQLPISHRVFCSAPRVTYIVRLPWTTYFIVYILPHYTTSSVAPPKHLVPFSLPVDKPTRATTGATTGTTTPPPPGTSFRHHSPSPPGLTLMRH